MVIHRKNFFGLARRMQALGFIDDEIECCPGFFVGQILFDQIGSPPGIDQMVKTHPGNVHFFEKLKYLRNFTDIEFVDGKPQPDFYAGILTVFNPLQRGAKSALNASEAVVDLMHAVEADADIGQPDLF